jgi:hypothetical protein
MVAAFRMSIGQVRQVGGYGRVRGGQWVSIALLAEAQEIAPAGGVCADGRFGFALARVGVRAFRWIGQLREGSRQALVVLRGIGVATVKAWAARIGSGARIGDFGEAGH